MKINRRQLRKLIMENFRLAESTKKNMISASQLSYLGRQMEKEKYPQSVEAIFDEYEIYSHMAGYSIVRKGADHKFRNKLDHSEYSYQDLADEFNKRLYQQPSKYFKP